MSIYKEEDAIDFLFSAPANTVNIVSLGYLSRYIKTIHDPADTFYMNGSMGLCLPFGIGISMCARKRVQCIIGDGSFIMNLQSLLMLKSCSSKPGNLVIIVIDNQCHNSTGQQNTYSEKLEFRSLSEAFGITFFQAGSNGELGKSLYHAGVSGAPALIHVTVAPMRLAPLRITQSLPEIKQAFLKNSSTWII